MYSSIEKIDIVLGDGTGVQTDHRTAQEIDAEWELSVVLAIARARNPIHSGQVQRVRFAHQHSPPERLRELVARLGAELEVAPSRERTAGRPDAAWVDGVATQAVLSLGRAVLARAGLAVTAAGVRALEEEIAGVPADDEIAFPTAIIELGAALATVIHATHGGTLAADDEMHSLVPYLWSVGGSRVNVFGRVERFLGEDDTARPSQLLAVLDEADADGPIMYALRAPDWAGRELGLIVPLLEGDGLPLVALVVDLPSSTRSCSKDGSADEIARLRAQADANLAGVVVQVAELEGADSRIFVVHGHDYAAEKLLDRTFMADLARRLRQPLLLAAVPARGRLFVAGATSSPGMTGVVAALARTHHDDAAPSDRISPAVLLVDDKGAVVGHARVTSAPSA